MRDQPYFLENEEWYEDTPFEEFCKSGRGYKLTEKAPPEAVKSYEEYYKTYEFEVAPGIMYVRDEPFTEEDKEFFRKRYEEKEKQEAAKLFNSED